MHIALESLLAADAERPVAAAEVLGTSQICGWRGVGRPTRGACDGGFAQHGALSVRRIHLDGYDGARADIERLDGASGATEGRIDGAGIATEGRFDDCAGQWGSLWRTQNGARRDRGRLGVAARILRRRGLLFKVVETVPLGVAAKSIWTVCGTNPMPHSYIEVGTMVYLTVYRIALNGSALGVASVSVRLTTM